MQATYEVLLPMPELGALPGDILIAAPSEPRPLGLWRDYDRNRLHFVLDNRVRLLSVSRPLAPPLPAEQLALGLFLCVHPTSDAVPQPASKAVASVEALRPQRHRPTHLQVVPRTA